MTNFGKYFLSYFEGRFPFFAFTLPVVLLIYPIIPALIPLYMLPKYYGLHFLYLFLMLFNLRIQRDFFEEVHITRFKKSFALVIGLSALTLIVFSILFNYLERGRFYSDIQFNWRSFFFFLSCGSLLLLNWLWYFIGRKLVRNDLIGILFSSLRYPLIILPPVLLNLHDSQYILAGSFLLFIFLHSVLFEIYKNKSNTDNSFKVVTLSLYTVVMGAGAYLASSNLIFLSLCILLGILLLIFREKLDQKIIFGPSLIYSWGIFLFINV